MSSIRAIFATATVELDAEVDYRSVSGERNVAYRPDDVVRAAADALRAVNTTRACELANAMDRLVED